MQFFLTPLLFLPVMEIVGFVTIGGNIGLGWTFLWLIGSTMFGFYLLKLQGLSGWQRARAGEEDVFDVQDLFDSLATLFGALLLIFPGFISDFIAIPFILAPFRHWMFGKFKNNPDGFVRRYARETRVFTNGTTRKETIIEGEFRNLDNSDKLP